MLNNRIALPVRALALVFMVLIAISTAGVGAAQELKKNVNSDGIAAKGYDLVSYFVGAKPEEGESKFSYSYQGTKFLFSSAENLNLFKKSPEMYLPAYGGFCSYGVVLGKKFDISPDAYRIVNDVLFLQLDKGTRLVWEENIDKNIEIANRTWPNIQNIPADDL